MTESTGAPVSVLTPVYNGGRYLAQCIESVLSQTYENWEYVILDNASTDETADIIARYAAADSRIRSASNERTVPYIQNWNRTVALVDPRAAYFKFVHADDWLMPECLQRMVEVAERYPEAGVVGSWILRGDRITARWEDAPADVISGRDLGRLSLLAEIPYLFGSPSALLLRAKLTRRRDPLYPPVDHPLVDQHLCYDLLRDTDFGYVRAVLTANREHDESITAGQEETNEWYVGKLTLLAEFGPDFLTEAEQAARVEHYLDRYYRFLAGQVGRARGTEFWAYHAEALADLGLPLDRSRLWREALAEAPRRLRRYVGKST